MPLPQALTTALVTKDHVPCRTAAATSVLDQPHPEARNDGYQGVHGRGRSDGDRESRLTQNGTVTGNCSVHDQPLHEGRSDHTHGTHRSSGSAGSEEFGAVQNNVGNGSVPAQSF
uniref:Uncharacterized protein n=1 Tax=Arundo donax TaxID=35708 RepID=A0A0A9A126_ARUDO